MKYSQLVSTSIALITGLSALCLESASALAAPPVPSVPFAQSVDFRAGLSLDRAKGWDFRLLQTPLSSAKAMRFFAPDSFAIAAPLTLADVTTGVGLGVVAGWVAPEATAKTSGSDQSAALTSDVKAEREGTKLSSMKLTIPDFIVYPSVQIGSSGSLNGLGCTARGKF